MDTQPPAANSQTYDLLMGRGAAWLLQTHTEKLSKYLTARKTSDG